ncbi:hypothetical protein [Fodinicurvata sediminis]|uniref:hypothetical protein n=1 Tax=Fodinicurvata sediminis TaxID=1121832 RepID=UPI0012DDC18F|nr:hypothetical protein [Fodinicurvata sediminis]
MENFILFKILNNVSNILPATVVAAVILFVLKEILEEIRRRKQNARKRKAVRRLISDEIERNKFTIKVLRDCISYIEESIWDENSQILIRIGTLGQRYFRQEGSGGYRREMPIRQVHNIALSSNLFEVAKIDEEIFDRALDLSDTLKELDHVLQSMIEFVSNGESAAFLEGFVDYAKGVLDDCENKISSFYKLITKKELENHRIR